MLALKKPRLIIRMPERIPQEFGLAVEGVAGVDFSQVSRLTENHLRDK